MKVRKGRIILRLGRSFHRIHRDALSERCDLNVPRLLRNDGLTRIEAGRVEARLGTGLAEAARAKSEKSEAIVRAIAECDGAVATR